MNTADRILAAREGGAVERMHTAPHVGSYSVAAHSHGIIMLMLILHPAPPGYLLKAAALHDVAERWTGDVPGYILRVDPLLREQVKRAEHDHATRCGFVMPSLTPDDEAWLKSLDTFELWLWCVEQLAMGNRHVEAVEEDVRIWLETDKRVPVAVRDAFHEFARKGWRRLRHADLPETIETEIPKPMFNAECAICRDAGKKAHVGKCMTAADEANAIQRATLKQTVDERTAPHQPEATACGCRECLHWAAVEAERNSTAAPMDGARIGTILAGYGDPGAK